MAEAVWRKWDVSSEYIEKLKSECNEELFKKLYMGEFYNLPEYNRPVIEKQNKELMNAEDC
ncbi:hypothetical protein M0P65_07745 [Candidatus Gracilibacteria bacterium]|jgi:hypothetical protein|nr:hypothetical protein [Candidatus Gracilibacteria bacterium]